MAKETNEVKEKKRDPLVKKKGSLKKLKFSANEEIQRPVFEDDKSKGWIKYGKKNLFPDFLLDIFFKSGKHNSIINRKIKMIAGSGFENSENEVFKNEQGSHSARQVAKLVASDQEIFKGFAIVVRWNDKKDKVAAYDYMPFHKVRQGTEKGVFWVSNDWGRVQKPENKPFKILAFDNEPLPKDFKTLEDDEKELHLSQLCYFVDVSVGTDAYPIPNYFASVEWILTDDEIGKFSYNLAKKNFLGGYHIGFNNGIPEDNERQQAKDDFKEEYGGTSGEDIVITFSEPEAKGTDFNPLPSAGNENIFENTEKRAAENIFIAHEVTSPVLFGIRDSGGSLNSNKDEQKQALESFQAVYIDEKQENIEEAFTKIFEAMGYNGQVELKTYTLEKKVETTEEPKDVEAEAKAKLKGSVAGVQGILAIQTAVSQGINTIDQGAAVLELIYGIGAEEAKRMLTNTKEF